MKIVSFIMHFLAVTVLLPTFITGQQIYEPDEQDMISFSAEFECNPPFSKYCRKKTEKTGSVETTITSLSLPAGMTLLATYEYQLRYRSNFCLDYRTRTVSGSAITGYAWGADGNSNADVLQLNTANGSYQYARLNDGQLTALVAWTKSSAIQRGWNTVRVLKSGDVLILYINGTEILRRAFETPAFSEIGFFLSSAGSALSVDIDYAKVYEKDFIDEEAVASLISKSSGPVIQRRAPSGLSQASKKMELSVQSGHVEVSNAFLSPNGQLLVSNEHAMQTGMCKLWDVNTGMEIRTLPGYALAFSNDGKRLTIAANTEVYVASTTTGKRLFTIPATYSAVSPDGNWLVATFPPAGWKPLEDDAQPPTAGCAIYNLATGAKTVVFGQSPEFGSPKILPDGKAFFMTLGQRTHFWSMPWGGKLGTVNMPIGRPIYTKDHSRMSARVTDTTYVCISTSDRRIIRRFDVPKRSTMGKLSPDGKLFLVTSIESNEIMIWNVETGEPLDILKGVKTKVLDLVFSEDSKFLFTADETKTYPRTHSVIKWDVQTGQPVDTIQTGNLSPYEMNVYGSMLRVFYLEKRQELFDVESLESLMSAPAGIVNQFEVEKEHGKYIAPAEGSILLHDLKTGKEIRAFRPKIQIARSIQFDPTGRFLLVATSDQMIHKLDLAAGRISASFPGRQPMMTAGNIIAAIQTDWRKAAAGMDKIRHTLSFMDAERGRMLYAVSHGGYGIPNPYSVSGDEKYFLQTTSYPNTVEVHSLQNGKLVSTIPVVKNIQLAAINPVNERILVTDYDSLHYHDMHSTDQLWSVKQRNFFFVRFSRDGKAIAVDDRFELCLLSSSDGRLLQRLKGHTWNVIDAAFNPDGSRIVTGSQDLTLRVWNTATGQLIKTIRPFTNYVSSVAWSPDGNTIAACGVDGKTILFDAKTLEEIATLVMMDNGNYVVYTPDNYYAASKGSGKGVGFTIEDQAFPFDQFDL
ncbi:MAG: hypothetical protein KDC45_08350, partial [Bacteroidetes bacterium]|nr:hypothetical protein [Bacteroidota bacterium]